MSLSVAVVTICEQRINWCDGDGTAAMCRSRLVSRVCVHVSCSREFLAVAVTKQNGAPSHGQKADEIAPGAH